MAADRFRERNLQRLAWIVLISLCAIGGLIALRRITAIAAPTSKGPAQLVDLDQKFVAEAGLTLLHIVPAVVFVILVPFQFSRKFRNRHFAAHRWMGRITMFLGLAIGLSGFLLIRHPVGGALEVVCILLFDCLFLFFLAEAYLNARARQIAAHREWVIRAMSVALGVATVRPIMGVFFATSRLTGLRPHDFFGIAFWVGFTATYAGGEWWIRRTATTDRRESRPAQLNPQSVTPDS